ncbi:MAG: electron transport complex subunit RsxC [Lachnospiraceae bacterium]|nr:electron transport complex subunit RsxC [Lachnospiraceae bacterium]
MVNYTKYVLKSNEELTALLADLDNIFVVACNKCFKEFDTIDEPECAAFCELAAAQGKTITGTARLDFLCNSVQTEKKLEGVIPEGTQNIVVISCGLGVQIIADIEDKPVFSATNSLNYIGHHGMALTEKTCDACAQCYLNLTGGICPITDCTKSLLNGQCGGAKNGKCEIDPEKDCAWEKIYQRLEKQGRQDDFAKQPVQIRDYSVAGVEEIKKYVAEVRAARFEGFYGGVHPVENKEYTEHIALQPFPAPKQVIIPTGQHVGAPATPIVAVGDTVKVGQKIAEAPSFISAHVHSSVSGTVTAVEPRKTSRGEVTCIVIESDGKDELHESVVPAKPLDELTPDEIVEIVKEKGITGMGGAGFPTYVKLKPSQPIDTVLINGSECEPYLTADHRLMLEYADDIIFGLKAIMKAVNAPKGVILVEDNKPDAVALMQEKTADIENIEVCAAKTQYPEGAEKMLIKRVLKRHVPSGKLPADVGCVVSNTASAKAISDAIQKGLPLIERVVSVTGEHIKTPGNFMVKIGTNVQELIDHCGGITGEDVTLKMGGPMMGAPLADTNVPVIKGTNGIIAIDTDHSETVECLKCGRCVDVCPMELAPLNFAKWVDEGNAQALLDNNIRDCFSCKCCEYICSAKIPLVAKINQGKGMIMPLLQPKK